MKRIILDTDIDTDCDDTGALAVLHGLMNRSECELLGVVCSVPVPACAGAVHAINTWYGRGELPIGQLDDPQYQHSSRWARYREHRNRFCAAGGAYNDRLAAALSPRSEPAVDLYRRLLAGSADKSVTICAIGTLTALAQLLRSRPDGYSELTGLELIRPKVAELVSMAVVDYPCGREAFNWFMDMPSAAEVVHCWPGSLTISAKGETVLTGARFMSAAPPDHPVRQAYATFLGALDRNRPSWDLIAALYAVRGLPGGFSISPDYGLTVDVSTDQHAWTDEPAVAPRRFVTPLTADAALARELEDLMIASLREVAR